jgi:hypothetical protein
MIITSCNTLDEQILNCARANSYTNKNYGSIESQLKYNEIDIRRPKYNFRNGSIYFEDPGYWEIYNHVRHYIFKVTDKQFKQCNQNGSLKP